MLASGMVGGDADLNNYAASQASTTSIAMVATTTQNRVAGVTEVNKNIGLESEVRLYFKDTPIMAEVVKCESRFRQFETDGFVLRGKVNNKDVGLGQINEYYHSERAKKLGLDLHTVEGNLAYAKLLYEEEGTRPWKSSSPCWNKSEVAKAMSVEKKSSDAKVIIAENIK